MAFPSRQPLPFARRARRIPRVELLEERNLLTFFGGYLTADEILAYEAALVAYYPAITELVDYGDSYSKTVGGVTSPRGDFLAGYDLQAIRITNRAIPGPKPVSIIYTGLHAREISTPEIGLRFVELMAGYYGYDPDVTWIVDHHETWVIPLANPDGHWYVELGTLPPYNGNPWLWRKSGNPTGCNTWPGPGKGVDLNRNFQDHWGGVGSSGQPCSETYRGSSAASEPETVATQNLIRSLIPDQRGPNDSDPAPDNTTGIFVDVHTYGGYVLWPWGHTSAAPPNSTGLRDVGRKLASYNGYVAGQSNQTLYPTTGTSNGWVYTELGSPAYTIELNSGGFLAPYSSVNRLWGEVKDSLFYAARTARTPYQLARGPDAKTAYAFLYESYLITYAEIDDRQNGGQQITAAEFYLDTPPWLPGATPIEMYALDGSYNSSFEPVYGYRTATDIPAGRHLIYMRGRDAAGNWGPFSASFLDIPAAPGGGGSSGIVPSLLVGAEADPVHVLGGAQVIPAAVSVPLAPAVEHGRAAGTNADQATTTPAPASAHAAIDSAFVLAFAALGEF